MTINMLCTVVGPRKVKKLAYTIVCTPIVLLEMQEISADFVPQIILLNLRYDEQVYNMILNYHFICSQVRHTFLWKQVRVYRGI